MCRFCNHLKHLKELEEKEYKEIIGFWRRRDLTARNLIKHLVQLQVFDLETQHRLLAQADRFVKFRK